MGKNLVFVPECPSTNTLAFQISQQPPVNEGTVVITDNQIAGRGQRGNSWEAEPGLNLTFSLILKPGFLAIDRQFYLNIAICLALKDYLEEKTSNTIYIKWPNDILVHEKKISGILIENQLQGSQIHNTVVGIGFNVSQMKFASSRATSLALATGKDFRPADELPLMLGFIEGRYLQLRQACLSGGPDHFHALSKAYLAALYRRGERHFFSSQGRTFEGSIEDIDEWGKLRIKTNEGLQSFGVNEIQYIFATS